MAPVGKDELPETNDIMSHSHNSHTLFPKIPGDTDYPKQYRQAGLQDTYLVDFPGMFESRGPELDVAMSLALQKILMSAKSAKVLVLVQASILLPDSSQILTQVKKKLEHMFQEPEEHVVIGITKARMQQAFDDDELIDVATGSDGQQVSFDGYTVVCVEQDDPKSIVAMLKAVSEKGSVQNHVCQGFLNPQEVQDLFKQVNATGEIEAN